MLRNRPSGTFFEPPGLYIYCGFETTGIIIQPFTLKSFKAQKSLELVPVVPLVPLDLRNK